MILAIIVLLMDLLEKLRLLKLLMIVIILTSTLIIVVVCGGTRRLTVSAGRLTQLSFEASRDMRTCVLTEMVFAVEP